MCVGSCVCVHVRRSVLAHACMHVCSVHMWWWGIWGEPIEKLCLGVCAHVCDSEFEYISKFACTSMCMHGGMTQCMHVHII